MKRTICDIKELPSMDALRMWAKTKGVEVKYLGQSLKDEPIYYARRGVVSRLAKAERVGRRRVLWDWESPLERLDHGDLGNWGNHLNRKGWRR